MKRLVDFYEIKLNANGFYDLLLQTIKNNPDAYNEKLLFLENNNLNTQSLNNNIDLIVKKGNSRIDMPVLIGKEDAKERILVLGLEPRHSKDFFNIMKVGNKVFATTFGADRWFSKKKKNIYATAFKPFLTDERLFLFSDFVKEYKVIDSNDKIKNSEIARNNFKKLFENKYRAILEKEISIFQPTKIIGLGITDISKKVEKSFLEKYNINVISHVANGNILRMQKAMTELLD